MSKLIARTAFAIVCAAAGVLHAVPAQASALPVSLRHLAGPDTMRFVAVIAADIDADGDLDVIASDHALQLYVFVNDGAGHFTRRNPARSTPPQSLAPLPALDGAPIALPSFTPTSPPTFGADTAVTRLTLQSIGRTEAAATPIVAAGGRSTRTPRAPPLF